MIRFVPLLWCDEQIWGNVSQELDGVGEVLQNGVWDRFITVIGTPHGDPLIAGLVGFQREEDRFILKIM